MKKSLLCGVAGLVMGVTLAGAIAPQDPATQDAEKMMATMQANMAKYMEVTSHHRELAKRVGAWDVKAEFQPAPGAPMETMNGTAVSEAIWEGRYILETFSGTMPEEMGGATFEGYGLNAYDNFKQKHVGMWIDSMSTGIFTTEGTEKDGAIHYEGKGPDFMTGGYKTSRSVEKWLDDNTRVMEMYETGPDGKDVLSMRLTYTRAAGGSTR